jgi:hypothetical protein
MKFSRHVCQTFSDKRFVNVSLLLTRPYPPPPKARTFIVGINVALREFTDACSCLCFYDCLLKVRVCAACMLRVSTQHTHNHFQLRTCCVGLALSTFSHHSAIYDFELQATFSTNGNMDARKRKTRLAASSEVLICAKLIKLPELRKSRIWIYEI